MKLEAASVIEDTDDLAEWVSNLMIGDKKNGTLRICLDPKPQNPVIKHELYTMPAAEEVQPQLSGKWVFTLSDMKDHIDALSL